MEELVLWDEYLLIRLRLSLCPLVIKYIIRWLGLVPSCGSILCLQFFGQHLIQSLSILPLFLLILLHEVKDIDGVHREVYEIILLGL